MFRRILLFFILAPNICSAGQISGGGGELLGDQLNPWFIQNTSEVPYCIQVNTEHFSLNADQIDQKIKVAISIWKHDFAEPTLVQPNSYIRVGTQTFTRVSCSDEHLITFQAGYLTPSQLEAVKEPEKFVSLALRTEYDRKNLRAKGFIYLAPDSGPSKPKYLNVTDGFWSESQNSKLTVVLQHELGHVFGIPHSGASDSIMSTMDANFPAMVIENQYGGGVYYPVFNFMNFGLCGWTSKISSAQKTFFNLGPNASELKCMFQPNKLEFHVLNEDGRYEIIGSSPIPTNKVGAGIKKAVGYFDIPQEQNVFPMPTGKTMVTLFYQQVAAHWVSDLVLNNNATLGRKKLIVTQSSDFKAQITGVNGDEIILDLIK